MPGRNGTGPVGQGSMTGRGMGFCTGARPANYNRFGYGMGYGRGVGRGLGLRRGYGQYYNDIEPVEYKSRKEYLVDQKEFLKQQLDIINSQLEDSVEDSK